MAVLFNHKYLKNNRKILRNHGTPAEVGLWNYLKNSKLKNKKFRRQYSIGNYIVDFYCPSQKLAVELDGNIHHTDKVHENDVQKTQYLYSKGITLIRFNNEVVFNNLDFIINKISTYLRLTTPTPP